MKRALLAIGYVWSAPWGACGLLLAALFWACGWVESWHWWHPGDGNAVLSVALRGRFQRWQAARNWNATTVGWCVFWYRQPEPDTVVHELRHVRQALVLGPLFPLVYAACWLWALIVIGERRHCLCPGDAYAADALERDARRAAGEP